MPLKSLKEKISSKNYSVAFGEVVKINATVITATGLNVGISDMVKIVSNTTAQETMGMVTEIDGSTFFITPFSFVEGFCSGDRVFLDQTGMNIPVGSSLLGRVVDPFMRPIDGKGSINASKLSPIIKAPIAAMKRGMIDEVFSVGVKSIDGLLTCGKGQKLGIFAGSGVGKSTLMGMIVRGSQAPIKVVALIGERGREVPEFIEKNLGGDLTNTVIIVATSDDSPLMRKYGAFAAMSVAEHFKDKGLDVLFIMDSVTRFAMAQREIGLAVGEPPTTKGYTPSVFTLLPRLMERAGNFKNGSITAIYTVLVDGDDLMEPIADASRSILDGHIVLSRKIAEKGRYPAIDVLKSISRLMNSIADEKQKQLALRIRKVLSVYADAEDLVNIGAYVKGSNKDIDEALQYIDRVENFLAQKIEESFSFNETLKLMESIFS